MQDQVKNQGQIENSSISWKISRMYLEDLDQVVQIEEQANLEFAWSRYFFVGELSKKYSNYWVIKSQKTINLKH